jgi:hypothetical protein
VQNEFQREKGEAAMSTGYRVVAGIGLLGAIALMAALLLRSSGPEAPPPATSRPAPAETFQPGPSVGALKARRASPPPAEPAPGAPVDLLHLVDATRDAVQGRWGFDGDSLYTSSTQWGRLQINYVPPAEYDLKVVVRRESGGNSFNLGLSNGHKQFMLVIDGNDGITSGIDLVGDRGFSANETTFGGKVLAMGVPTTLDIAVRKGGVTLTVGKKVLMDWQGPFASLQVFPNWRVQDAKSLFLGSWQTLYRVDEMVLTPLAGDPPVPK